jgi:hypothetical protein
MIRISPRCFGVSSMIERHLVDPEQGGELVNSKPM